MSFKKNMLLFALSFCVLGHTFADGSYERKQELLALNIKQMQEVSELKEKLRGAQLSKYFMVGVAITSGLFFAIGTKFGAFKKITTDEFMKRNLKKSFKIFTASAAGVSSTSTYFAYLNHQEIEELIIVLEDKEEQLKLSNELIYNY